MARVLFIESILPQIKVGLKCTHSEMNNSCLNNCVAATCLFLFTTYMQATLESTVDVRLPERREEYINSISKAEACVYCDTVLFVAEGGFPFRQHQCGPLSSLSGFQSNCVCLNDVYCGESKREPGSCLLFYS